ncbi:MAG: ABC transporter permease [Actinobacteria bacterium]|nr:ABC transporter permease [Actinomycetota bacterium]
MIGTEALRSVRASMSTTVAATMTVLIGMFLLGLSIALGSWVLSYSNHVKSEIHVKVYYCTPAGVGCTREVKPTEINAVARKLRAMPEVKSIEFISKQEALRIEHKKYPELVDSLPYNPYPHSHEVTPTKGEYAKVIRERLTSAKPPGVEKVKDGGETASRVIRVGKIVETVFLVGVILLLVASTLLIGNTIRLAIFARRREIEVMKLVGASNWFVRGPFMLEGLLCGLAGSLGAVLLLVIGKKFALGPILGHVDSGDDAHAIAFELNALIIVGMGLLLAAAGSGLTVRRFLKV